MQCCLLVIDYSFQTSFFIQVLGATASFIGLIVFVLTNVPFKLLAIHKTSLILKLAACLFPNTAMSFGFMIIDSFEKSQTGKILLKLTNYHPLCVLELTWNMLWTNKNDSLVLGHIFIMLLVDIILFFLLVIYLEVVFPGKYGKPRPWYIIRRKSTVGNNKKCWRS